MENALILLLALAWDILLGEPPRWLHPVVGMGKAISLGMRQAPRRGGLAQLLWGAGLLLATLAVFFLGAYFLLAFLKGVSLVLYVLVGAFLLKSAFSIRGLGNAATRVRRLLAEGKIEKARFEMRSLVSRDTEGLSEPQMVAATVESVAENTGDSIVAPLFYFGLLGVPGALGYRVINTADAMMGYHGRFEYLGKFAARFDDVLNYLPSRLTGLLIVAVAFITGKDGPRAWRIMLRDHSRTESPNAGWPMAAAAGALGSELSKVGHYRLGDALAPLSPPLIDQSLRLMWLAGLSWAALCLAAEVVRFALAT